MRARQGACVREGEGEGGVGVGIFGERQRMPGSGPGCRDGVKIDPEICYRRICADGAGDGRGNHGWRHRSELQLVREPGVAQVGLREHGFGHARAQLRRGSGALQSLVVEQRWRRNRGGISPGRHRRWPGGWLASFLEPS